MILSKYSKYGWTKRQDILNNSSGSHTAGGNTLGLPTLGNRRS